MGNIVGKLNDRYYIWSTVVDSPIFWDATKEELEKELWNTGLERLTEEIAARMARVEKAGHSMQHPGMGEEIMKQMEEWVKKNGARSETEDKEDT